MPLSHVYPMPPCSCMALPAMSTAAPQAYDFAIAAATPASGRSSAMACTAALTSWRDTEIADQHVGAGVLDGLERADGPAELLAHLRVADRRGQHCLRQPRLSQATATAARSCSRRTAAAWSPSNRSTSAVLGRRRRRPAGASRRAPAAAVTVGVADGDAVVGDDEDPVGALGVGHELAIRARRPACTAPDATSASSRSRVSLGCSAFNVPTASTALPR